MIFKNLLLNNENNLDKIIESYMDLYPLFEDYELDYLKKEKGQEFIDVCYKNYFSKFRNKFHNLLSLQEKQTNNIIFILKLKETRYEDAYNIEYIHSFECKKDDILDKVKEPFVLWNDSLPRIEHYCYDYTPMEELLGTEVYYSNDVSEIEVICTILYELFLHGFEEEDRTTSLNNLTKELEKSMQDVKEGKCYDAKELFESLENEMLESYSEEDRKTYLEKKKEKEKNKERDFLYSYLVNRINHKKCISLIEEWYLKTL